MDGLTGGVLATLEALTEPLAVRLQVRADERAEREAVGDPTLNLGAEQAIERTLQSLRVVENQLAQDSLQDSDEQPKKAE